MTINTVAISFVLLACASPITAADSNADNTGINERDRSGATVQPMDQSLKQADIDVTTRIRQAVTKDDSLSINAKNVKIITENGRVTLRGPVKNEAEKKKLTAIAKKFAERNTVINELEIEAH